MSKPEGGAVCRGCHRHKIKTFLDDDTKMCSISQDSFKAKLFIYSTLVQLEIYIYYVVFYSSWSIGKNLLKKIGL